MSRYVIHGAGAIGAVLGGRLALAGREVMLIARGAHGEALEQRGLELRSNAGAEVIRLPVVKTVLAAGLRAGDILVLATKTQDAIKAMEELAAVADPETPVVCAQNGLESEHAALRLFKNVYGALVLYSAAYLEPGVASYYQYPLVGVLDVGRFPLGVDEVAEAIAADFRAAGFDAMAQADVMHWKRGKLVGNMINAISAACEKPEAVPDVSAAARAEAEACFRAEGLSFASTDELQARAASINSVTVAGERYPGGSTFQSLARGAGATESDYLSGEIVLRGRMAGVPTPVNDALQRLMRDMARSGAAPRSLSPEALRQAVMPGA